MQARAPLLLLLPFLMLGALLLGIPLAGGLLLLVIEGLTPANLSLLLPQPGLWHSAGLSLWVAGASTLGALGATALLLAQGDGRPWMRWLRRLLSPLLALPHIAFAIGILSMLGDRVPVSLKIFLTALAIADDLGAILVIALFYGGQVQISCLLAALVIMLAVYFMKEMGEKRMFFYLVPAVVIWGLFYYSGVHSAISGVAMAMLIPMTPRYSKEYFAHKMRHLKELMLAARTSGDDFPNEHHRFYMRRMRLLAADSVGMSYRLEHSLAPYVTFLVMPIFALANAGVEITSPEYLNIFHYSSEIGSIGMGIFFGLVVGKPLGIFLASWGAVKSGLAVMPEGATWRLLLAVACLGGIGFTMSLFVDALAYTEPDLIDRGKIAILMGSTAAAVLGSLLILVFSKKRK